MQLGFASPAGGSPGGTTEETGIETPRCQIPERAELERGETTRKGRRKTTKKQKPHRAWILCVTPVCWQTSAELQHWGDCAARLRLIPLAQFQRNSGQAPLSSQIQPGRSARRTHSRPATPVLRSLHFSAGSGGFSDFLQVIRSVPGGIPMSF